ncbi:MAG: PDDEXK nuclease domain-containing protein [Candidatus Eisenbacteria bacterium]
MENRELPANTPSDYAAFLGSLKERIRNARVRAALAVNSELILLYWLIGRDILARQAEAGWGAKVIAQLADDLRREFPDMKGLSARNLQYMRQLAESWPDEAIAQQLVAQIPWGHNVRLLDRVKDPVEREWYARATIQHGWSRAILDYQIDTGLARRQGKGVTNFERTLPAPQSELAMQVLKDPYNFDFLGLGEEAHEREIHRGLLQHLRQFLIELGAGFAFVGSEVHLEVEGEDFYIDLLFYHLQLRCYIVIELKATDFKPEYAGKLNFYLSAVDDMLRHPDDRPSIGLIICRGKKGLVAEYALRDMSKPMAIAEHQLTEELPEILRGQLPTVAELQSELERSIDEEADNGSA